MKKKKVILFLLVLLFIGIIILIVFNKDTLKEIFIPIYKIEDRTKEVKDFSKKYKNEDVEGWIRVQGTNIDYPVVNAYNDKDYGRVYDYTWVNGSISKNDNYIPIFGHNLRNVSNKPVIGDNSMARFEQLMSYIYYEFNQNNKYIQFTYKGKNYLYQIYSVRLYYVGEALYQSDKLTKKEKKNYIEDAINNSYFKYNVKVDENDNLLSLITCTRFYGDDLFNFKVDAKLVKNKNIGYNYSVIKKKKYESVEKVLEGDEEDA